MNKPEKSNKNQLDRVQINQARIPKKKTVHADPFARLQLHPLEELEARDNTLIEDATTTSLFDSQPDQVEPSKTNQVRPGPNIIKTKDFTEGPSRAKTDQVEPSRAKLKTVETSPSKNYTKVPNSITKLAIPEKYFRGLSKHTYDILYQRTRGAISPSRTIQLTKNDLVKLTGLAIHTVKLHIKYLNESGLLVTHRQMGKHTGYIYEIFVPEEIEADQVQPSTSKNNQNLASHADQNMALLGHTKNQANKALSEHLKTSLKTNTIDDDALVDFASVMNELSRKFTNKDLNKNEKEKWKDLANLLAMELEIAAARTNSISSIPAFLTEHLRRRLIQKISVREVKASRPLVDESIESNSVVYEAEVLSQQGREVVLKTFIEYVKKGQKDFVLSFEETYTKEDWRFLMENLK